MKTADIEVGKEYAVGLGDWDKRHPKRARVLETGVERVYKTGITSRSSGRLRSSGNGVKVVYVDNKGQPLQVRRYPYGDDTIQDHEEVLTPQHIIKFWDVWEREDKAAKRRQRKAQKAKEAHEADLDARVEAIANHFPGGIRWGDSYHGSLKVDLEDLENLVKKAGK